MQFAASRFDSHKEICAAEGGGKEGKRCTLLTEIRHRVQDFYAWGGMSHSDLGVHSSGTPKKPSRSSDFDYINHTEC